MARFPSIDSEGAFEAPEVQNSIKELVTGTTDGITVDTSVGTRVFVGDTMIHGDTGWRDVDWLPDGINPTHCRVRRSGDVVSLSLRFTITGAGALSSPAIIPHGFRPRDLLTIRLDRYNSYTFSAQFATAANGTLYLFRADPSEQETRVEISWTTSNSWPTSLPGVPA